MSQIVLTIVLEQETGAVQVTGPIQNTILSLGLLEMAKDAVLKYAQNQGAKKGPPIYVAGPSALPPAPNGH